MRALTDRQTRVLTYIHERLRECGAAPTIREVSAHMSLRSIQAGQRHLDALEAKGMIVRQRHVQRGISVTPSGLQTLRCPISLTDKQRVDALEEHLSRDSAGVSEAYLQRIGHDFFVSPNVFSDADTIGIGSTIREAIDDAVNKANVAARASETDLLLAA